MMRFTAPLIPASQKFHAGIPLETSEICVPVFVGFYPRSGRAARRRLELHKFSEIFSTKIAHGLRNRRQICGLGFQSELSKRNAV
jgi:hypothetical protein